MLRTVRTENGWVKGIEAADPRITAFKGIPFAAPPVGENRWRAPQPCEDWDGVRECYRFAPISMQSVPGIGDNVYIREWHVDPEIAMDEDCLYLNVWTGAKEVTEKQPVLVWFFGGGLQCGYPAEMEFDGERIARRGVVVVTVNYRVNVFGFLAHPQLTEEQPDAPTNFGSLDQQAALRWVQRNIAFFGGDPGNVTIAGQSAGGGSVMSQMACMDNEGLFHRAVVMSAMIRSPYQVGGIGVPEELWHAEENGQHFLSFLGCSTIEQARKLDAATIRDKYEEYTKIFPAMFTVLDHKFCVGDPMVLFMEGKHVNVPVMSGNTSDEFPSYIEASSKEDLKKKAEEIFGKNAETFLRFPEAMREDSDGKYAKVNGIECTIKCLFSDKKSAGEKKPYYYYRFDPDIPGWDNAGTFHSVDLWFFFETLAKCWRPFVGQHYDLSRMMCNYWVNFIKTGDPNGNDADGKPMPYWYPYEKEKPCEMIFMSDGPVVNCGWVTPFKEFLQEQIKKTLSIGKIFHKEWLEPIWEGEYCFRETFAAVADENGCRASFLWTPKEVLSAESYDGETVYEEGIDYLVEGDELVIPEGSHIPVTGWDTFLYPDFDTAKKAGETSEFAKDFGPLVTTNGKFLNLCAIGNPKLVTEKQIAVTYKATKKELLSAPESQLDKLPKLSAKLEVGEPVKIVLYGDSVCCGCDCSGMYGQKPGQPTWAELLFHQMEEKWQSPVCFHNTSVGGVDSEWAIENSSQRAANFHPDLVILGFGMNDRCGMEEYRNKTGRLIEAIRKVSPKTEFLLIASTLPNELAATEPHHFWAHQDEYSESLKGLEGMGVAIADIQAVQKEIGKRKRYIDITGNWLNHPNDYLARILAQVVIKTLGM